MYSKENDWKPNSWILPQIEKQVLQRSHRWIWKLSVTSKEDIWWQFFRWSFSYRALKCHLRDAATEHFWTVVHCTANILYNACNSCWRWTCLQKAETNKELSKICNVSRQVEQPCLSTENQLARKWNFKENINEIAHKKTTPGSWCSVTSEFNWHGTNTRANAGMGKILFQSVFCYGLSPVEFTQGCPHNVLTLHLQFHRCL